MKHSVSLFLLLTVFSVCGLLQAQHVPQQIILSEFEFPIAGVDNMFIPFSNPSLLATEHAEGLGIAHLNDEEVWQKHYWLLYNTDSFSYIYEREEGKNYHTVALGSEFLPANVLPNLYIGTNYKFAGDKYKDGHFRSGVTYRPNNGTSLAMTWDNPNKGIPYYRGGVALRPFAWVNGVNDYRLELSADMNYANTDGEYKFKKPIFGVQTQILDGIKIGGTYNTDEETTLLTFSLASRKSEIGGMSRMKENDNYGVAWAFLTESNFKPFLGLTTKNWYNMKLTGNVKTYRAPKYEIGPFKIYDSKDKSVESIIATINAVKADPNIEGILLQNPSFACSYALQQELLDAFDGFKASGKKVSFYYNNMSNSGYMFAASIADKIYLNPMGSIDLKGMAITSPYIRNLLNELGVEPINFRSHKYKSAGNMFSETEMTAAEREVYDSILQSFYDQMVARVNLGRGDKLKANFTDLIDKGPYFLANDALDKGLVDELIYEDQLNKQLKDDFKFSNKVARMEEYRDYNWAKPKEHQIAVIYASGNIVMGKGTPGQKIGQNTTVKLIRNARKNKAYKGIILRVDSGGGSAQASDIILRELTLAQTENKKPVVVSMGGVAGSGGYYIACKADRIVADPATITGSIGVIGLMFNATEMFKKVKINWSTVKKGENADFGSMYRPWKESEKEAFTNMIEWTYEDFVKKVDEGRKPMNLEQVHQYAQGRIWTGAQALEIGLVDDLGGLDVALQNMQDVTGIKGKLKLVDATSKDQGISVEMSSGPLMHILPVKALEAMSADYKKLYELWDDFYSEKALMYCPVSTEDVQF
jgi:protease-4